MSGGRKSTDPATTAVARHGVRAAAVALFT
ncbi:hypothetical protein RKD26_000120 [Streptomyces calvus]